MKVYFVALIVILSGIVMASTATAQIHVLDTDFTARSQTMGNAIAGISDDINTLSANPAGLAFFPLSQLSVTYNKYLLDTNLGHVVFSCPVKKFGYAVSFSRYDGGKLEVVESGQMKNSLTAQSDDLLALSGGGELIPTISAGVTVKYVKSTLLEKYTVSALALDAGVAWKSGNDRYSAGCAVHNLGSPVRYRNTSEELPLSATLGLGMLAYDTYVHTCRIGGGVGWKKANDNLSMNLGAEYEYTESFVVRMGYNFAKTDQDSLTIGIGFNIWQNQFDYALLNAGSENIQKMTCTFRFGPGGSLGKGRGFYNKGMYSRAIQSLEKIPENHQQSTVARNLIRDCRAMLAALPPGKKIAKKELLSMPAPAIASSEKYTVDIKLMKDIPTAIYNLLPSLHSMPISVSITNNSDQKAEFKVLYRYEPKSQEQVARLTVGARQTSQLNVLPALPSSVLSTVAAPESQIARVSVYYIAPTGELRKVRDDFWDYVTLYPFNQYFAWVFNAFGEKISVMETLAAWVTYNDPALTEVVSKASDRGAAMNPPLKLVGGQDPRIFLRGIDQMDRDYMKQVELLYNVLKDDYHITYLNQPIVSHPGMLLTSQRVKFPYHVLQYKGNCIELAVLFASLLESIEINPIIVLLPVDGHCVVGWEVPGAEKNVYHLLETNNFGEVFEKVLSNSEAWIEKYGLTRQFNTGILFDDSGVYTQGNDVIILNIRKLRKRIPPSSCVIQ